MGCKWETWKALECPQKAGVWSSLNQSSGRGSGMKNMETGFKWHDADWDIYFSDFWQKPNTEQYRANTADSEKRCWTHQREAKRPIPSRALSPSPTSTLHVRAAAGDLSRRGFLCRVLLGIGEGRVLFPPSQERELSGPPISRSSEPLESSWEDMTGIS